MKTGAIQQALLLGVALLHAPSHFLVAANEHDMFHDEESTATDIPPHKGCTEFLKANHDPQPKLVGAQYEKQAGANPSYTTTSEKGATSANCSGGFAGGYPCQNVDLMSLLDNSDLAVNLPGSSVTLNDIWGWTHGATGREFALVGTDRGTVFVEITDPVNPINLGALAGVNSGVANSWRDLKTYNDHVFIVAERANHGVQVFDLTKLLTASPNTSFTADALYRQHGNSHNIFVNEGSGFAYSVGSDSCNGGLHIIDVSNPVNPTFSACYADDGYTHDVQCVIYTGPDTTYFGREICFASNEDTVTIIDVTDKNNMVQLGRISYVGQQYTHQGWLTDDHAYFIFDDEVDEYFGVVSKTRTHVLNVSDLQNPQYAGYHEGRTSAIDHNLYVLGNKVFQANYRAGLNILEITDASTASFNEIGYFDLYPNSNSAQFNGAWSNYPYFPSGTIIMSGVEEGLFVLKYNDSPNPTPPPTTAPNPNPTPPPTPDNDDGDYECADDLNWFWTNKKGTKQKNCNWFGKRKNRCYKKPGAIENCPVSCKVCTKSDEEICTNNKMTKKACKALGEICKWSRFANPKCQVK